MTLIDGKATAAAIKEQIAQEVAPPGLSPRRVAGAGGDVSAVVYSSKKIEATSSGCCARGTRRRKRDLCEEQGLGLREMWL